MPHRPDDAVHQSAIDGRRAADVDPAGDRPEQEVIDLYAADVPVADIAARTGVSVGTIYKRIKAAKIELRTHSSALWSTLPLPELCAMLDAGTTWKAIAHHYGVQISAVRRAAAEVRHPRVTAGVEDIARRAAHLYKNGATLDQIRQQLGVNEQLIRWWLQALDVKVATGRRHVDTKAPSSRLTPEQRALLDRLADGATIAAAADGEFVSLRTANRRIARARALFGVRATREAVLAYRRASSPR
jgi:DNA-binding CsgD family transcriptional regulator/uncharacterized protein YerC